MKHAARLARLERMARPSRAEAERDAVALLACITDAELEALITEAGGTCTETELWAAVDEDRRAGYCPSNAELAAAIFADAPDLLATCRARLAATRPA
jgi:hypothetical protein